MEQSRTVTVSRTIAVIGAAVTMGCDSAFAPTGTGSVDVGAPSTIAVVDAAKVDKCRDNPAPVIGLLEVRRETLRGLTFDRYVFEVKNRNAYPAQLFDAAPDLPPCGLNPLSSRTWATVEGLVQGAPVYATIFCDLREPGNLTGIWFSVPVGSPTPSESRVLFADRRCGTTYISRTLRLKGAGDVARG